MKWDEAKKVILQNDEVLQKLKNDEAEYKIIEEIIMARKEKKLNAKRIGSKNTTDVA
ncbi:hypothetical protein ACYULU_03170 [Breznakiellaceae bacterium SP9]